MRLTIPCWSFYVLFYIFGYFSSSTIWGQSNVLEISELSDNHTQAIKNHFKIKLQYTDNQFINKQPEFQFAQDTTYILQLRVKNSSPYPTPFFVDFGRVEKGSAFFFTKEGERKERLFGELRPRSQTQEPEYSKGKVRLELPPHFNQVVFFELTNVYQFKPTAYTVAFHNEHIKSRNWVQAFFHGAIWVLIFYNLIIFIGAKDITYLYYSLYMLTASGYYFFSGGLIQELFFPESPYYGIYFWLLTTTSPMFFVLFMRRFVDTPRLLPKWDKILRWHPIYRIFVFLVLTILVAQYVTPATRSNVAIMAILLDAVFISTTLVLLIRTRDKLAYFFVGATRILVLGIVLNQVSMFITPKLANYFGQFGIIAEVILFSVGLSHRIKIIEKEKQEAQKALIQQLEKNKHLQEKTNAELEKRVKNRTAKLQETNEELNQINEELIVTIETVNVQNTVIRKKNEDITAGINYAQRIQQAVFPDIKKIQAVFPESFIFFKPRDIVSGDFYYFSEKANKVFLIGADSTGHGVPGAFMSMIGHSFFNQIIHIQNITSPNLILEYMRTAIRVALKQDQTGSRDGMEVSVCVLHRDSTKNGFEKLEFSGAGQPLYYFRELSDEVQIFHGDRIFIGGTVIKKENNFIKHTAQLQRGFTFYIFSDGYADQFGGKKGRKFMKKRFRELLTRIHTQPLAKQYQILGNELNQWQGKTHDQVDDILVIGIRIE